MVQKYILAGVAAIGIGAAAGFVSNRDMPGAVVGGAAAFASTAVGLTLAGGSGNSQELKEQLEQQASELEAQLLTSKTEAEQLQTLVSQLQATQTSLESSKQEVERELSELRSNFDEAIHVEDSAGSDLASAQQHLDDLSQQQQALQDDITAKQESLDAMQASETELQQTIADRQSELQQLQAQIEALQHQSTELPESEPEDLSGNFALQQDSEPAFTEEGIFAVESIEEHADDSPSAEDAFAEESAIESEFGAEASPIPAEIDEPSSDSFFIESANDGEISPDESSESLDAFMMEAADDIADQHHAEASMDDSSEASSESFSMESTIETTEEADISTDESSESLDAFMMESADDVADQHHAEAFMDDSSEASSESLSMESAIEPTEEADTSPDEPSESLDAFMMESADELVSEETASEAPKEANLAELLGEDSIETPSFEMDDEALVELEDSAETFADAADESFASLEPAMAEPTSTDELSLGELLGSDAGEIASGMGNETLDGLGDDAATFFSGAEDEGLESVEASLAAGGTTEDMNLGELLSEDPLESASSLEMGDGLLEASTEAEVADAASLDELMGAIEGNGIEAAAESDEAGNDVDAFFSSVDRSSVTALTASNASDSNDGNLADLFNEQSAAEDIGALVSAGVNEATSEVGQSDDDGSADLEMLDLADLLSDQTD